MVDPLQPHPKRGKVFLSYDRMDRGFATKLAATLRGKGYEVLDPSETVGTEDTAQDDVLVALREADRIIAVVPPSTSNKFVLFELGAARALGKPIMAVMPDASRSWNSDEVRALSRHALIDASKLEPEQLLGALQIAS
jgi:nucleoside 2-deoxyribosyltransferase